MFQAVATRRVTAGVTFPRDSQKGRPVGFTEISTDTLTRQETLYSANTLPHNDLRCRSLRRQP